MRPATLLHLEVSGTLADVARDVDAFERSSEVRIRAALEALPRRIALAITGTTFALLLAVAIACGVWGARS